MSSLNNQETLDKNTELVLVETVSMYRIRYMVEVPKGKALWALDTMVCNEATEFSQEFIDENIVTHRVVSLDEARELCDQDNEYAKNWDAAHKIKVFYTPFPEEISNDHAI